MARKILLVDDAPAIVHAVGQILQVMGYEVITADGAEVMQTMTEQHPDLVLLDICISGCLDVMDGIFVSRSKSMRYSI